MRDTRIFGGFLPVPARLALGVSLALTPLLTACAAENGTIGALLGQRPDGRLFVRDVPPLLAAHRDGLAPGDEILLVDGKDVRALGERELRAALEGDVGSPVRLTIVRNDAVFRVTVRRTPPPRRTPGAGSGGD
ncbi:MAG TPA: PDZ domain-containing protein [Polyangiaceae bacterium]|nr:PDZ domain-containing protein [Polyangiaceae bacterium]